MDSFTNKIENGYLIRLILNHISIVGLAIALPLLTDSGLLLYMCTVKAEDYSQPTGSGGCTGIIGFAHSNETKLKISESKIGKLHSEETKKKISKSLIGKPFSKKRRENMKGRLCSKGTRRKLSKAAKNKSEETRRKLSESRCGEKHPLAKLNLNQVKEIRIKYTTGKYTHKGLAKEYMVSKSTITHIISYKRWIK